MKRPVFITGVERSGATIVTHALRECGAWTGTVTKMQENRAAGAFISAYDQKNPGGLFRDTDEMLIPSNWRKQIMEAIAWDGYKEGVWVLKSAKLSQTWPMWNYAFPEAHWIIVRRKTTDIINGCMKTGYLRTMKDPANLKQIGVTTEQEGWLWWVHQYEQEWVKMIQAGLDCKVVWPERILEGDYTQFQEAAQWCGLTWNKEAMNTVESLIRREGV